MKYLGSLFLRFIVIFVCFIVIVSNVKGTVGNILGLLFLALAIYFFVIKRFIFVVKRFITESAEERRSRKVQEEIDHLIFEGRVAEARIIEQNELLYQQNRKLLEENGYEKDY